MTPGDQVSYGPVRYTLIERLFDVGKHVRMVCETDGHAGPMILFESDLVVPGDSADARIAALHGYTEATG